MKRKLPSSEKGKGNQAITKFFKSLTPQGPKRSFTSMDNTARMKATKEEEFRTSLFEKFQTPKTSLVSNDSNAICSDNNTENDKGKSCNALAKPSLNDCSSTNGHNKVVYSSNPCINEQKMPLNSTPVAGVAICKRDLGTTVERGHIASSGMDCDETFQSAHEEGDSSYDTCFESLTDISFTPVQNKSTHKTVEKKELPAVSLSGINETDFHGSLNLESRTEAVQEVKNESCVHFKEHDGSFGQANMPLTALLSKDTESEDVSKDNNSPCGCDGLMEAKQDRGCDNFKEEESDKNTDQIHKIHVFNANYSSDHKEKERSDSNGCKEEELEKECYQINKPLNDIHLDSDLHATDGDISEGTDSSDEDLLTPPRFLYENLKLKPNIRTPEKGIAPAFSTPSPIARNMEKEDKTKYKLSFDKLIKEKAKQREKDAELAEMEAELQRGLEKGGIAQMQVPSTFSDIESEEELTDDGRDLKDCTLPKDIKKFLVEVHDFTEDLPGEDIFPVFHPFVTSQEFPRLSMLPHPNKDNFEANLLSGSDGDLQELLCGGWILQVYLDRPCPSEVADWLFQVMCRHRDQHVISSSFQVLWAMVEAAAENREDIPQDPRGSTWVPSIKKVLKELLFFGARVPRLYPGDLVNQLNIKELLSSEMPFEEMEDVTSGGELQTECFPTVNIMHLVQFLTHCLQNCRLQYTVEDLRNFVVLLCRLTLDVRLQTVVFDIEMCLAAVLNCFGEMQWPDQIKELCSIVSQLCTNHRNLLHLVQIQPPSVRGIQLQRLLSVTLLHWLVLKFCRQQEAGEGVDDERCDVAVPDSVEVSSIVKLVEKIKPSEDSNYFLLHTIISLVSLAVGSDDLSPKERGSLEKLTNKLRTLNGDIKDPRAAFMNRTKVKDLLVRTILRLAYMTQCIKPSREHHITSYFECSGSDYQVELLKETENEIGDELSGDEQEERAAGKQEMVNL